MVQCGEEAKVSTEDAAEGTADAEENNTEEAKNGNILTDTLLSLHYALSTGQKKAFRKAKTKDVIVEK